MFDKVKKIFAALGKALWGAGKAAIPFIPDCTFKPTAIAATKLAELLTKQGFGEKEARDTATALEDGQKNLAKIRREMRTLRLILGFNFFLTLLIFLRLF